MTHKIPSEETKGVLYLKSMRINLVFYIFDERLINVFNEVIHYFDSLQKSQNLTAYLSKC